MLDTLKINRRFKVCLLCDLYDRNLKGDEARDRAISYINDVINSCEKLSLNYRKILTGAIKPHTDEMTKVCLHEKHLVRLLIDDALN
jgi:hypothetical protein